MPGWEKSSCCQSMTTRATGMRETSRAKPRMALTLSLGKNASRMAPTRGRNTRAVSSIALSSYPQDCQSGERAQEQDQHVRLHEARLQLPEHPAADHKGTADTVYDPVDDAPVELVHVVGHPARHPAGRVDDEVNHMAIDPAGHQGQSNHAADEHVLINVIDVVTPLEQHPDGVKHLDDLAAGNQVVLVNRQGQGHARHPDNGGDTKDEGVEGGVMGLAIVDETRQR